MGTESIRKKQIESEAEDMVSSPLTKERIEAQTAWAAGTEQFFNRDPSFHLSESFTKTIDNLGKMHDDEATDMGKLYEPRYGDEGRLKKFAEIGFNRGNLSAAIINGTGKMMLVSCLKRTVGQDRSLNFKERRLFQMHSVHRELPASQNSMNIVNRGFAESATGMVVDVLKDARRSLNNLEKMAFGADQIDGSSGLETLHKMYPFLDTGRERALLKSYDEKLKDPEIREGSEQYELLQRAHRRIMQVLEKKEKTAREFLQRLRQLRERAEQAEKELSAPEFIDSIAGPENRLKTDGADDKRRNEADIDISPEDGENSGGSEGSGSDAGVKKDISAGDIAGAEKDIIAGSIAGAEKDIIAGSINAAGSSTTAGSSNGADSSAGTEKDVSPGSVSGNDTDISNENGVSDNKDVD